MHAHQVGLKLADYYDHRITWWVECFLLGVKDPYAEEGRVR